MGRRSIVGMGYRVVGRGIGLVRGRRMDDRSQGRLRVDERRPVENCFSTPSLLT
jgi:hypothetical protein